MNPARGFGMKRDMRNMSNREVTLNPQEMKVATWVGKCRQKAAEELGYSNHNQCGKDDTRLHIDGAAGELAFAKTFKLYPESIFDNFGSLGSYDVWFPELGGVDVKTTANKDGRLNIEYRKTKNPADIYALMIGSDGKFEHAGMIAGIDALSERYMTDVGNGAFFAIPQDDLADDLR